MRFAEWVTIHQRLLQGGVLSADARRITPLEFCRLNANDPTKPLGTRVHLLTELDWLEHRRPYYSLFPVAVEALAKLRLDVPWKHITLPVTPLLLRCAVGNEPDVGDGRRILSILIADTGQRDSNNARWLCWVDMGETRPDYENMGDVSTLFLCAPDDWTVEQSVDYALEKGNSRAELGLAQRETLEYARTVARLLAGVSLLADDPEMVAPDVLTADASKLTDADEALRAKLIDRAHRRGKVGWLFGAHMESVPHWRRPHFALRWTGTGGAIPKIVPIKGTVVHRQKLADVPTGRLDDDDNKQTDVTEAMQLKEQLDERLNRD